MKAYGLPKVRTCEYGCCFSTKTPEKQKHPKLRAKNKRFISAYGKGRERGEKRRLRTKLLRAQVAPTE